MAKARLTPALKTLLALRGDPNPGPAAARLLPLFDSFQETSKKQGVSPTAWLTLSSASLFTLNAPNSLVELYKYKSGKAANLGDKVEAAALMREVGLKCISFIGIAKIINELGILTSSYEEDVVAALPKNTTREVSSDNVQSVFKSGQDLWQAIYTPHDVKLTAKLASYHPDLPVHIHSSHYGPVLSNPPRPGGPDRQGEVDRVNTSLVAIACLRAQGGVGPQVVSHVLGLQKAGEEQAGWLATEEGSTWAVGVVDQLVNEVELSKHSAKL